MSINYKEFAERAILYAQKANIELDYSKESIEDVDVILGWYYDHLAEYDGEEGRNTLWNVAVHYGIYLGETLLQLNLANEGFFWYIDDGIPILKNNDNMEISPITKAHKRILYGPEDSVKSFCDVVFSISEGNFPSSNVRRAIDVHLSSGQEIINVQCQDIDTYITLVAEGKEDFIILNASDGYLQFYGIDNQFVAEIRLNFVNGDFRTFSIINKDKENKTERIQLNTPYGQFTPTEQEVVSLDLIKEVVEKYYKNIDIENLLKHIPYIETTEETKKYMS